MLLPILAARREKLLSAVATPPWYEKLSIALALALSADTIKMHLAIRDEENKTITNSKRITTISLVRFCLDLSKRSFSRKRVGSYSNLNGILCIVDTAFSQSNYSS